MPLTARYFLQLFPVTSSFTMWTRLMHVELSNICTGKGDPLWHWDLLQQLLSRTQFFILWVFPALSLFSGKQQQVHNFFQTELCYKDLAPHIFGLNQQSYTQRT